MKKYLVSYDLGVPEASEDYKNLIARINKYGHWAKPLQSVWFILSDKTALQVCDDLRVPMDSNDSLLVIEVTSDWAAWGVTEKVVNWMKVNI